MEGCRGSAAGKLLLSVEAADRIGLDSARLHDNSLYKDSQNKFLKSSSIFPMMWGNGFSIVQDRLAYNSKMIRHVKWGNEAPELSQFGESIISNKKKRFMFEIIGPLNFSSLIVDFQWQDLLEYVDSSAVAIDTILKTHLGIYCTDFQLIYLSPFHFNQNQKLENVTPQLSNNVFFKHCRDLVNSTCD